MFRNAYDPSNDTVAQLSPDLPVGSFVHLLNGSLFASGAQRFSGTSLTLGSGSSLGSRGLVIPSTATYYSIGAVSDWFAKSFQNGVPITLVAQCNVEAATIGTDAAAVLCGNSLTTGDKGFWIGYENRVVASSPNQFRFVINNGGTSVVDAKIGPAPVKGAKSRIVVKFDNWDGNNRVYFYINGVYYSYATFSSALATGNATRVVQVGKANYSSTILPFLGVIDCIAFIPAAMNHDWCLRTSLDPYPSLLRGRMARRWLPSAGGGDITITAGVGNAVASGAVSSIGLSQTVSTSVGNASAAGVSASISLSAEITVACGIGNAAAAGTTAAIGLSQTVSASVGNADAAGATAAIGVSQTIAASVGDAAAAGTSASIALSSGIVVSCSVGDAAAAGTSATIGLTQSVGCGVGDGAANGVTADVRLDKTITCGVGDAAAAGTAASIILLGDIIVPGVVGNAVASGVTASVAVELPQTLSQADIDAIAAAVWQYAARALTASVDANVVSLNGAQVIGTGTAGDDWRGVGVQP